MPAPSLQGQVPAAFASLAVVVGLVQPSSQRSAPAVVSVLLGVLGVTLSWALMHTVYAFGYAPVRPRGAGHRWHGLQPGHARPTATSRTWRSRNGHRSSHL